MRKLVVLALLFSFVSYVGAAWAQELTQSDRDFLLSVLPKGSEKISLSAEQLLRSSTDISRAAKDCSMDRELIGLGAAFRNASDALKRLEPMLLKQAPVGLGELVNPSPPVAQALVTNFERQQAYRSALDRISEAGQSLLSLDPIGSAGPPAKAGPLIRDAGQSLMELEEQSGIGMHLNVSGGSIEAFRIANLKLDKKACVQAARFMGQTAGLAGASLNFSAGILWQSAATKKLAGTLLEMSQQMHSPPLGQLERVLDLYTKSLMLQAQALRQQSEISLNLDTPEEWSVAEAKYHHAAPVLAENAARYGPIVARIAEARKALAGGQATSWKSITVAMCSAGATLSKYGTWYSLISTGEVLIRAGELLDDGQTQTAAQILSEMATKIIAAERPLTLEKP
jgi:hypothetical protein